MLRSQAIPVLLSWWFCFFGQLFHFVLWFLNRIKLTQAVLLEDATWWRCIVRWGSSPNPNLIISPCMTERGLNIASLIPYYESLYTKPLMAFLHGTAWPFFYRTSEFEQALELFPLFGDSEGFQGFALITCGLTAFPLGHSKGMTINP